MQSLVQEDFTCRGATKPNVPQLLNLCSRALKPRFTFQVLCRFPFSLFTLYRTAPHHLCLHRLQVQSALQARCNFTQPTNQPNSLQPCRCPYERPEALPRLMRMALSSQDTQSFITNPFPLLTS